MCDRYRLESLALELESADTQYQFSPAPGAKVMFKARTSVDVRYSAVAGTVATPTGNYLTLPAGSVFQTEDFSFNVGQTLYLAAGTAGTVIEIEHWIPEILDQG